MAIRIGIDAGGTFTDLVAHDTESGLFVCCKVPSNAAEPIEALLKSFAIVSIMPASVDQMIYATTIATNALIERKGARVAFVTTAGFEDIPYIQRINRRELYNLSWVKSEPLVNSRKSCFGLNERIISDGTILRPLAVAEVEKVCQDISTRGYEAAAVCLLFSFLNPTHEGMVRDVFARKLGLPFSISHEVAPIWREYERASTTIADAYLKPLMGRYISDLDHGLRQAGMKAPWSVMKSNGGIVAASAGANNPIQMAMSGPAGGMIASQNLARTIGQDAVLTIDMGGTSCDVGMIVKGKQKLTTSYEIEFGLPASMPLIDVRTIGAGGGSIAWVNAGGFLEVGPRSAGAIPGPACYDLGGQEPTVTDANLRLGRLDPKFFLEGRIPLSREMAAHALSRVAPQVRMSELDLAAAIIQVAENNMANAIRMVSVAQGYDPRDFTLIAFGGAGPLHASAIARSLNLPRVAVPPVPGNFSALGLLLADARVDKVWTRAVRSDQADPSDINSQFEHMRQQVVSELRANGHLGDLVILTSINMRYLGQNYENEVAVPAGDFTQASLDSALDSFHEMHETSYGYAFRHAIIELISFQVTAIGATEKPGFEKLRQPLSVGTPTKRPVVFPEQGWMETPIYQRTTLAPGEKLTGPAIIQEAGSTTLLCPGDTLRVDEHGILVIDVALT